MDEITSAQFVSIIRLYETAPGFALPVFAELGESQSHLVQDVSDDRVARFSLLNADGYDLFSARERITKRIGDTALLVFERAPGIFLVGEREKLVPLLSPLLKEPEIRDQPFSRAGLAEFCGDAEAALEANLDAMAQLANEERTQSYFRVQVLTRDKIRRCLFDMGWKGAPIFRLTISPDGLQVWLSPDSEPEYIRALDAALDSCKADIAQILNSRDLKWKVQLTRPPRSRPAKRAHADHLGGNRSAAVEALDRLLLDIADLMHSLAGNYQAVFSLLRAAITVAGQNEPAENRRLLIALAQLSRKLRQIGQKQVHLEVEIAVVEIARRDALRGGSAERGVFAASLGNVAHRYSEAGLYEEALKAAREAVEIRRQLATENFARYGSGLAHGLHELSYLLQRVGQYAEALVAGTEEIDLRRKAAHLGQKHLRLFANTLDDYVRLESQTGDANRAMARSNEAIIILTQLARDDPSSKTLDVFSHCLQTRSHLLEQLGDYQGALRDMEESIGIHRASMEARGQKNYGRPLLARRLQLYSELLDKTGMMERAKLAREEAAAIYRPIRRTPGKATSI